MQLLLLKNGRDHESQSDELGVQYSTKIGYDAKEMAGFFSTIDRLSGGPEGRVPNFLSTHPNPLDRFKRVGELAEAEQKKTNNFNLKVNRDSYLRMIDGIVYGPDPQQGYRKQRFLPSCFEVSVSSTRRLAASKLATTGRNGTKRW